MSGCCDRCDYEEKLMSDYMEERCLVHIGMKLPCPLPHGEDAVLDDLDAVVEQVARPRMFEDCINEWTQACLSENRAASDPAVILVITRLGLLGQRLLYESNDIGMREVMRETRERLGR